MTESDDRRDEGRRPRGLRERLEKMKVAAKALEIAAADAWDEGRLRDAAGLFARRDVAESRARDLEIAGIGEELGKKIVFHGFGGGARLL